MRADNFLTRDSDITVSARWEEGIGVFLFLSVSYAFRHNCCYFSLKKNYLREN